MNSYYNQGHSSHYNGMSFVKSCWVLLAVGFISGMTYLWLYSHIVETSSTIQIFERKRGHLRDRCVFLESKLEYLQNPSVIRSMLEERNSPLVDPYPEQLVRVNREEPDSFPEETRTRPPQNIILSIAR